MQALVPLFIPLFLLAAGLLVGKGMELYHFRKLTEAEKLHSDMIVTNLETIPPQLENTQPFMVIGAAVIATDYFKVFASNLRTLFGGEMKSYVSLMERARRQAVVRMLEQAKSQGARVVWNVRYETTCTGGQKKKKPGGVEILAYGTALK